MQQQKQQQQQPEQEEKEKETEEEEEEEEEPQEENQSKRIYILKIIKKKFQCKKMLKASVIDNYAKIIFPSVFLLFNLVYWTVYLEKFFSNSKDLD